MTRRRALMARVKSGGGRLPAEYQEVEYLESTGRQFILTGLTIAELSSLSTNWSLRFALTRFISAQIIAGVNTDEKQLPFLLDSLRLRDWCGYKYTGVQTAELNKIYEIKQEDGYLKFDGTSTEIAKKTTSNTFFALFAKNLENNTPEESTISHMRLYGFSAKSSGVDKANMIPCYRKSDNKPGLYDLVSETFLTNGWQNEFLVGPDVN